MQESKNHYCLGGEAHPDGCDCSCSSCETRRKDIAQEAFNRRLSERIKETSGK